MELKNPKGTRDYPPEEKILRDEITSTLKGVFERYGFSPFETPMMEHFEVLSSKYTGGAEILKETFKLNDQGGRELGLRYDLTVPLARFMAQNPRMKMPFKRYHVGEVFRDGPVTTGRYRQFTQCDVDVIGASSLKADAELLALAQRIFRELDLDATLRLNSRKLLTEMMLASGVSKEQSDEAILIVDKLDKVGESGVRKELSMKHFSSETIDSIISLISISGSNQEKLSALTQRIPDSLGLKEIGEVLGYCEAMGVDVTFDLSLARGLTYYTGPIFEVVLKDSKITSSVSGGGRYDGMIGALMGKTDVSAVGISFGLDRIFDALSEKRAKKKTVTQLLLIPINTFDATAKIAEEMRNTGINVEVDLMDRGPSKNLQYADALGIPFVGFVGEEEVKSQKVKLKNMKSGEEGMYAVADAVSEIKR